MSWLRDPPRRNRAGVGAATAAFLLMAAMMLPADADVAAGRRAYDKGDYNRAMMEWQAAADRGDADAEFGLGSLYEFGAGDLEQDYNRAAYWYRKAADRGNTEAQYRLALLYSAGGDNFKADLVEAYKWASLAGRSPAVWGTLAGDFKNLLDKVTSPGQRGDGEKRAAVWTEVAKTIEPAAVPAPPPPGPVGKAVTTGCPGWPFPTLPCTEQFPALAGAQGPPPAIQPAPARVPVAPTSPSQPSDAAVPLEELNKALTRIDCAALRGRASAQGSAIISGTIADAAERTKLVELGARFFPASRPEIAVEVVPPPLCHSLAELNVMPLAGRAAAGGLGLHLANGGSQLREGDPIELEVRAPGYPVNLRIDYFSLDGQVLHLKPDSGEPPPKLAAGTTHVFGNPANGEDWRAGGMPFGTEFIAVTASPEPLELGSRPRVEQAADYLRDLKHALDRADSGADTPSLVATLLVKTSGR